MAIAELIKTAKTSSIIATMEQSKQAQIMSVVKPPSLHSINGCEQFVK
jgi:hypothetical protein